MGRRKIEIQPITHERNRSVTFLKRKNGLFKKAYELGVLCSVDVAVIIFEERAGHHVKLYQYCSSDIKDIVQRHVRHDGEKDLKTPADFSGGGNGRMDDTGDGDDDDGEDDSDQPRRTKRRTDGKLKPGDMSIPTDAYRNLSAQPASNVATSSSLPVSSDRLSSTSAARNSSLAASHPKRQTRHGAKSRGSRSPSEDHLSPAASQAPYVYGGGPYGPGGGGRYPGGPHGQGGPGYPPFYGPGQASSPSFIPLQSEFSRARGAHSFPRGGGGGFDPGMHYPQHHSGSHMMQRGGPGGGGGGGPGGGGSDLFSFLDGPSDEGGRPSGAPGFSLDWPVHGPGSAGTSHSSTSGPPPSQPPPPGGSANDWLEFLSNTTGAARDNPNGGTLSWERGSGNGHGIERHGSGGGSPDLAGIFAGTHQGHPHRSGSMSVGRSPPMAVVKRMTDPAGVGGGGLGFSQREGLKMEIRE